MEGYTGRIAHIDLDRREVLVEKPEWGFYRHYLGGRNLALHYLLKEIPQGADPLSPENVIVVSTSILTGSDYPGTSRFSVAAKSPLTGGFGEAEAGGWFGPELKRAGFDALVIRGRAAIPTYIWVHDSEVELRHANVAWGLETANGHEALLADVGDQKARVLQIGPAGERLVRFACLASDLRNFCGRCGLGAVFGSKQLRAIVARGTKQPEMHDPATVRDLSAWFGKHFPENEGLRTKGLMGTMLGVTSMSELGLLPTRNFQHGSFEAAESIGGEHLHSELVKEREGCRACPVRCKRVVTGSQFDTRYGGPEFESVGSLGSCCGVGDPEVVVRANERCNALGLDTISTGVTIAFAMECSQRGLLPTGFADGIDIRFGNGDALLALCELIAKREGAGNLLAEGSLRASRVIGRGAEQYSMTVKGQELPAHDPRGKWGVALGYAVSPTGADHLQSAHDTWFEREPHPEIEFSYMDVSDLYPFGIYAPMKAARLDATKVVAFAQLQKWWSLHNVLDLCIFVSAPEYRMTGLRELVALTQAITGWNVTDQELLRAGELGITLARLFNALEGETAGSDVLPNRLHAPLPFGEGTHPGVPREEFAAARELYYQLLGWDAEGHVLPWKEQELAVWQHLPVVAGRP